MSVQYTVLFNGEQIGPHSKETIVSMLSKGMIDNTAMLWCEGWPNWLPITNVIPPQIQPSQSYDSAVSAPPPPPAQPRRQKKPYGWMAKYKYRVGLRSFILQCIVVGWTAMFIFLGMSMMISSSKPSGESRYDAMMLSPEDRSAAQGLGVMSGMCCAIGGWALVAIPCGIGAIATMENNKL